MTTAARGARWAAVALATTLTTAAHAGGDESSAPPHDTPAYFLLPAGPRAPDPSAEIASNARRAERRAKWAARIESRAGAALSTFTGVTNGVNGVAGLRVDAALPLAHGFYWGPSLSYMGFSADVAWPGAWAYGTFAGHGLLVGAALGWGAPFDNFPVGLALGLGGGTTWSDSTWPRIGPYVAGPDGVSLRAGRDPVRATGYGRVAVTVQIPLEVSPLRPTFSFSGMHLTNELGASAQVAMLELGLAWQVF